jgi:hypothetical protein
MALTVVNGNKVVQSAWTNTNNQKWRIVVVKNTTVKFINQEKNYVLDIPGNSPNQGTEMWVHEGNGTPAQQFQLV